MMITYLEASINRNIYYLQRTHYKRKERGRGTPTA